VSSGIASADADLTTASSISPGAGPGLFLMTNTGDTGGTERQFAVMAEALGHGPFRVETGCLQRRGSFFDNLPQIQEFPLGGSFASWRAQRSRLALARHLRRRKIAIAHSFDFYTNLMLLPTARLAGIPVLIGSMRQLGDRLSPAQTRALAWVLRWFPDRIVCNSRAAAARLADLGVPARKPIVIANALPEECFRPVTPALPRGPNTLRIGLVARMNEKVKNHPALLRATAVLLKEFPHMEVVLAGDGHLRPELEKMATDLGVAGNVRFLGERRDIPAVLASLDISVLVSLSESLPNAILEAMAAGVPVVSTRVGGSPEVVHQGETGFLVDSGNDAQMVEALRALLRDESLRKQLGTQGRDVARAQFGIGSIQKQYEDLYAETLQEKRGRAVVRPNQPINAGSGR
jgi:glycosyltransferase involved in cell wall biosynthesis